ncbi:MAG: DEAD/DEAH box helicase [Proteobacteria bacterium]|nr:DEAD/DEAH box helicase [Pseudomonadota bacterium]
MPFPPLPSALQRALAAQGYSEPTPVQAAVLEADAAGRDLLVSAQTGSGKTVAFGLAMGPDLLGEAETLPYAVLPSALVIAPTRELALQVNAELTWLYGEAGARIVSCVGGMDPRKEQRALMAGAHIVVGTPGRLKDHLERGNLDLSALKVVVLDEADEMLDMGFREDLEELLDAAPAERRTLLFSATIARDIAVLAKTYQKDAVRIDTVERNQPHGDIDYRAIRVAPNQVELAVVNVLRWFEAPGALVFCNTREAVNRLHSALRERGFNVVALSGELTQKERSDALQALRDARARVCVATDVAARGLDLPDLGLVVHAELPINKAALLHRSGRTGRAGRKGVSVLLVPYTRRRKAEMLLGSAHIEAEWMGPPAADAIRARDEERLLEDPSFAEVVSDEDMALGKRLLERLSAEQLAGVLIRERRARLPEPEELFDAGPDHGAGERPPFEPREPRADRLQPDEVAWFRMTVGRAKNADPKWILPLICRLGHVVKKDIGSIRIFDRETKFEIALTVAEKFEAAVKASGEGDIRIEPSTPPGQRPEYTGAPRERAPREPRPERSYERKFERKHEPRAEAAAHADARPAKPYEKKPYEKKAHKDGPRPERFEPRAAPQPYDPLAEKRPERPFEKKPRKDRSEGFKSDSHKPRAEASGEAGAKRPFDRPRKTFAEPRREGEAHPPRAKEGFKGKPKPAGKPFKAAAPAKAKAKPHRKGKSNAGPKRWD